MTFLAFVAYGGNKAKKVAERLGEYLEKIGISTFVASSVLGKWLIPGEYGFDEKILGKLQKSDIVVLVSTRKTVYRKKVRKEILEATYLKKPIIVLKKKGTSLPFSKKLRKKYWVPELNFNPSNPSYIFPKVAIYILLHMEQLAEDRQQLAEDRQQLAVSILQGVK